MPAKAPYGYSREHFTLTVPLATFLNGTGQINLLLSKTMGYACELERVEVLPTTVGTGAGASRVINVRKGNATGSIIGTATATLANQGTLGVVTVGTVTSTAGVNALADTDALTVEFPAGGTAFTAGGCELILTFRDRLQKQS